MTPLFQERCRLTRIEIKEGEQVEASEKKTELLEGIQGFDHFEDRPRLRRRPPAQLTSLKSGRLVFLGGLSGLAGIFVATSTA